MTSDSKLVMLIFRIYIADIAKIHTYYGRKARDSSKKIIKDLKK